MRTNWWDSAARQIAAGQTDERICCHDCGGLVGALGDWCMLEDDVWAATGLAPDGGVLCLPCIERRLGRQLEVTDFAVAEESDRGGGFWPGRRMLPQRWGEYLSRREALP